MIDTQTVKDFSVGDTVQHVFFAKYATVRKVGRKYLTVVIHCPRPGVAFSGEVTWLPTSVRKVEA